MSLYKNLILIYGILPYVSNINNKWGFLTSMLLGNKKWKVKINNHNFNFKREEYSRLFFLLGLIEFAFSYKLTQDGKLDISLDGQNKFSIPIVNQSYEDENLIELLFKGSKKGANFIDGENIEYGLREKQIKIYEKNGKKIVETSEGIKFYLDSIHPSNTIVETFIEKIHQISSLERLENKIILDIGAECGDTALFYANLGATVYSFEPIKDNFEALKRNLSLNSEIAKKIIPTNVAIGENKILKFFKDPITPTYGASFVQNKRGKNAKIETVQGYSLETALEKFSIENVELMKMDCKGCEFFLTELALQKIQRVKIEYSGFHQKKTVEDIIQNLKNAGFSHVIYRGSDTQTHSNKTNGYIYAEKGNSINAKK